MNKAKKDNVLKFPSNLSDGEHTLAFKAWDVYNNANNVSITVVHVSRCDSPAQKQEVPTNKNVQNISRNLAQQKIYHIQNNIKKRKQLK